MTLLQTFSAVTTLGPAQSNRTVTHAAVPLGTSLPWVMATGDGVISNCWDTYVTMQRLSETQTRFDRAGNGGTLTVAFGFARDSRITAQYMGPFSGLAPGANVFAIPSAPVDLTKSWIVNLGLSASGDRDNETGVRLAFQDASNVEAMVTTAAGGQELNFCVITMEGLAGGVQSFTDTGDTAKNIALGTAVDPAHTAIWVSERTTTVGAWDSQDVDTIDLLDANNVRVHRYRSGAGSVCDRAGFVVPLPSDIAVRHLRATVANGVATVANAIAPMVNVDRAILIPNGACNPSDYAQDAATRVLSESEFRGALTSGSNVDFTRSAAVAEATVAMQLLAWASDQGTPGFFGSLV